MKKEAADSERPLLAKNGLLRMRYKCCCSYILSLSTSLSISLSHFRSTSLAFRLNTPTHFVHIS